jgi:uncharacterized protein YqiB (DUF1249 family)
MQLFPDYETTNYREFQLGSGERVRIDVVERSRYTTQLRICQQGGEGWLAAPRFDLRAYHDARMVEVISFQSQRHIEARYDYPNTDMHAPDEKAQQNIFLAEWLSHCLEQGCSTLDLPSLAAGIADAS